MVADFGGGGVVVDGSGSGVWAGGADGVEAIDVAIGVVDGASVVVGVSEVGTGVALVAFFLRRSAMDGRLPDMDAFNEVFTNMMMEA